MSIGVAVRAVERVPHVSRHRLRHVRRLVGLQSDTDEPPVALRFVIQFPLCFDPLDLLLEQVQMCTEVS